MSGMLQKISCPGCGQPIDLHSVRTSGAQVECNACGSQLILRGHVCPYCGTYHEKVVSFCRQCGAGLIRRCPHCETVNWIGDEYCAECGAVLDILELVVQRHNLDTQARLYRRMEEAISLKEMENAASETRMARFVEEDRRRFAEIQRRRAAQLEQERKQLIAVAVFGSVFVIIMIIVALVINSL